MFTPHRLVCVGYTYYHTPISYIPCIHPTHTPASCSPHTGSCVCVWVTLTITPLFPAPPAFTQHTLLHHVHPTQARVCVCGLHLLSHPYFLHPLHSPNTHSCIMFTPHRRVCVGYTYYHTPISYIPCIHPTHTPASCSPHTGSCVWVTLTIPPLFPMPPAFTQHTLLHHVHPTQACVCGLHLLSHPYFLHPLHSPNTHSCIMYTPHRLVCVGYTYYPTPISYAPCIHPTHTPASCSPPRRFVCVGYTYYHTPISYAPCIHPTHTPASCSPHTGSCVWVTLTVTPLFPTPLHSPNTHSCIMFTPRRFVCVGYTYYHTPIEGFHVKSLQQNLPSHAAHSGHVGSHKIWPNALLLKLHKA